MKNIKYFKYKNTGAFMGFLGSYDYKLEDVKGFSFDERKQYHGNVLTWYCIHFNDGEKEYFKAVSFKSFNEYHPSRLGFNGNKLLEWFENADIREYKENKY